VSSAADTFTSITFLVIRRTRAVHWPMPWFFALRQPGRLAVANVFHVKQTELVSAPAGVNARALGNFHDGGRSWSRSLAAIETSRRALGAWHALESREPAAVYAAHAADLDDD
jgi:hypothetical protein